MIRIRDFEQNDFASVLMLHPEHAKILDEIQEDGWFEDDQFEWTRTLVDDTGDVAAIVGVLPGDEDESLQCWALLTDVGRRHPVGVTRSTRKVIELAEEVHHPSFVGANAETIPHVEWLYVLGFNDDPQATRRII